MNRTRPPLPHRIQDLRLRFIAAGWASFYATMRRIDRIERYGRRRGNPDLVDLAVYLRHQVIIHCG